MNKLSVKTVAAKKTPGYYGDGGGLYLQVTRAKAGGVNKSWVFRYRRFDERGTRNGAVREMGLGSCATVSLAEARSVAGRQRDILTAGTDPVEARNAARLAAAVEATRTVTFSQCAQTYIDAQKAGWKNAKHAEQWGNTLSTYCYPVFGDVPVQQVDKALVLRVLEPVWTTKPETARRVRGRIERVLDYAAARDYRKGENPARWKGHLDKILPALKKKARVKHHPALPYEQLGDFMVALRKQAGVAAQALELAILTATRTNEIICARCEEFDLEKREWIIPALRMKAERDHRVPLSDAAVKLLKPILEERDTGYVFLNERKNEPLSNNAMLALLERMGRGDITVHGFRSTFRDWAAEVSSYPRDVCEMALAHVIADETEAAYRRGDLMAKRRKLMDDWSKWCDTPAADKGQVLQMEARAQHGARA
jgi:integrase